MPIVKKQEVYVTISYELMCSYERAEALAQNAMNILSDDKGLDMAKDITCGFDRNAIVKVGYASLKDAIRLDKRVRELLSISCDYSYEFEHGTKPKTSLFISESK